MKSTITTLIFLFFINVLSSQTNEGVTNNTATTMLRAASATQSSYGSTTLFYNPKRAIEGSIYLFNEWENNAIVHTKDNYKYLLKNINLDIKSNSFVSKIGSDSIFTFNMNNIKKIVINNKAYKNVFSENGKRICEVIYESDEFSILKGFSIQKVTGSPNPMVNRASDKIVRKKTFFLKKDNTLRTFKLSKKKILGLLPPYKQEKVKKYVKENRLSYKEESNLSKIMSYSYSLK